MADRERDLDRLLTFVDAVVAIAITLLVLPLAELGVEAHQKPVIALLHEHLDDIGAFALSFVVIARLWVGQHRAVSGLVRQSTAVLWALFAWTFTIVVLPFPTSLVAATNNDPVVTVFYIGTMTVSSALMMLVAWLIGRDRNLRDTDDKPELWPSVGTTAAFLAALLSAAVFPAASYWPLLLLVLVGPLGALARRTRARTRARIGS